jgi:hypothetical protein
MITHTITRPGMKAIEAELIFASPSVYVFLINGVERTLAAKDGLVKGFYDHADQHRFRLHRLRLPRLFRHCHFG